MLAIKGVMKEELENAKKAYGAYKKAINKLPVGVLVKKEIKGRDYYYLVFRKGKKIKFIYHSALWAALISFIFKAFL